jgi:hypothetical protein
MNLYAKYLFCAAGLAALVIGSHPTQGQRPSRNASIEQELVHTEFGFFEAWKTKDVSYFRSHIPENGVYWSDAGTFSREEQVRQQEDAAKNCIVDGYSLSDFGVPSHL